MKNRSMLFGLIVALFLLHSVRAIPVLWAFNSERDDRFSPEVATVAGSALVPIPLHYGYPAPVRWELQG